MGKKFSFTMVGQPGIEKAKTLNYRMRSYVFWPNTDKEIEEN